MDGLHKNDSPDDGRFSQKMSRRKKSRPVKFSQDFEMHYPGDEYDQSEAGYQHGATDFDNSGDFDYSTAELSSVSSPGNGIESYEGSPISMPMTPEDQLYEQKFHPSSAGMVERMAQSYEDTSGYLVVGSAIPSPKRIKLEPESSPEPINQTRDISRQQEQETTFSSLLHSFASHVTRTELERQSPHRDKTHSTLWQKQIAESQIPSSKPTQSQHVSRNASLGAPSTIPGPMKSSSTPPTSQGQSEVSFSGMLKSIVSCVNDSQQKEKQINSPSLVSLLQNRGKSMNAATECQTRGNPSADGTLSSSNKNSPSFSSILHGFASVVDKKGENLNDLAVKSPSTQQSGGTKSLLDVLHDTISRRVMETSPSLGSSATRDRNDQPLDLARVKQEKDDDNYLDMDQHQGQTTETSYDLHPSNKQWSHIRNVLPPLDPDETHGKRYEQQDEQYQPEDGQYEQQDEQYQQEDKYMYSSEYDIGSKRSDDGQIISPSSSLRNRFIKEEPVDDDYETGQSGGQVQVKTEPIDFPCTDPYSTSNVNSTLRERLLHRIESRQSSHVMTAVNNSSTASSECGDFVGRAQDTGDNVLSSDKKLIEEQPVLMSHLLKSGDSVQWRNKCEGSFADLLHNITSSMLDREKYTESNENESENLTSYHQPGINDEPKSSKKSHSSSAPTIRKMLEAQEVHFPQKTPKSDISGGVGSEKSLRAERLKALSYEEAPSTSSSLTTSSEEGDHANASFQARKKDKELHSLSPRSRHAVMKHKSKRGSKKRLKLKLGWPNVAQRKDSSHHSHSDSKVPKNSSKYLEQKLSKMSSQPAEAETSFTDLLQKLAQKCQAGSPESGAQPNPGGQSFSPTTATSQQQPDLHRVARHQDETPSVQSSRVAELASTASLRNLLTQQGITEYYPSVPDPSSEVPSTSGQVGDISFSNLMQDMACTVKKKASPSRAATKDLQSIVNAAIEDLRSIVPSPPWIKSVSGNWLRFLLMSSDENPKVNISVAVNLWNNIHELKIHCHHLEVPVNHWIFRRFGKRVHTKVALHGVLEAIHSGCSICEGTVRSDLVQMYRNKLAPTSRWQSTAVLEDSFGTSTVRSKQCELLISGLRRSRDKRCSKCSMYVDRKLKAVMYHMRKKLGIS